MTVVDITKEEAAAAIRASAYRVEDTDRQDYGRVLIHTFAGPFGADWDLDDAIHAVSKSTRCGWVNHILGHDLGVVTDEGRTVLFQCKRPDGVL